MSFLEYSEIFKTIIFETALFLALIKSWRYCMVKVSEAFSEPCLMSKMEPLVKIVNGEKPSTIFAKRFILSD